MRLFAAIAILLFCCHALAQPGNPMPPPDPGDPPVNVPAEAIVAMVFMIWATMAKSGPLREWAERNGWLAVLAVLGVPIFVGMIAK